MSQSQYGAMRVGAKTSEVVAYHRDQGRPGKPLHVMIPGGLLALASLALMIWIAYATWYQAAVPEQSGLVYLVVLAPVYAGSVFLFSYGYELYDVPRALRLTAIVVFISLAAVIILAVLFALLSKRGSGSSSTSDDSTSSWGRVSRWNGSSRGGSIDFDLDDGSQIMTREVIREVPMAPDPVLCKYCGVSYVPAEGLVACPGCGAAKLQEASR